MSLVHTVPQDAATTEPTLVATLIHIIGDAGALGDDTLQAFAAQGYKVLPYEHVQNFGERFVYDRGAAQCMIIVEQLRAGVVLQQRLANANIRMPVIYVIERTGDIDAAVQAMKLGALDMLFPPCVATAVNRLVQSTLEHEVDIRRQSVATDEITSRLANLTHREQQVLELLVGAHSTKSIASRLNISPKTVFVHRARVLEKVGVDNLVELSLLVNASRKN